MTNPRLNPLALQEITSHAGFTHMAIVTSDHLTQATANTPQTIKLGPIPVGAIVHKVELRLAKPFRDKADAAHNSTTATVGDNASPTTFIPSKQLNANGTYIPIPALMNTATGPYAAPDQVNLVVSAMVGKNLNALNEGEVHVFVQILDPAILSVVKGVSAGAK